MVSVVIALTLSLLTLNTASAFIGGRNATKKEIRQIVSLRNVLRDNQLFGLGHHCGGAVLTDSVILTCASCLSDTKGDKYMLPGFIRVVGGTLNKDLMEETTFDSSLNSIRPHPGYNFRSRSFNIAVVRMGRHIPFKTHNLETIKLAEKVPPENTLCNITGWGKTKGPKEPVFSFVQTGRVVLLPMKQCAKFYKQIPANTLCFGGTRVSVCEEDVGSVVFCNGLATAVIALVELCTKTNSVIPFVATSVPSFHSWIKENDATRSYGAFYLTLLLLLMGSFGL